MPRLVLTLLLAVAVCAVTDATYPKYRQWPVQSVAQPVVQLPAQSYYLSPGQRVMYINGLPYAVLGEQLQYVPAASAGPSVYTAPVGISSIPPPAGGVNVGATETASPGPVASPASDPPASTYGSVATVPEETSQKPATYVAPAPLPEPAPAPLPEPAPAPLPEPAPASAPTQPAAAPEPAAAPSLAPENGPTSATTAERGLAPLPQPALDTMPAPAAEPPTAAVPAGGPGPAPTVYSTAQNGQAASVYMSGASQPSLPSAQRIVRLTVSNPQVTVHRRVSEYSWHHPAQNLDGGPIQIVFYNDGKQPTPLTSSSNSFKLLLNGEASPVNLQPNEVQSNAVNDQPARPTTYSQPQQASQSAPDLIDYTLAQSALLRVFVDPATRTSYMLDSQGRRIDLPPAASSAAPVPIVAPTSQYPYTPTYSPYGASGAPLTSSSPSAPDTNTAAPYYGAASGMPTQTMPGASESYKTQDMTGLKPLESMYAPSTYNGPAPQSTNYDKPLLLSISTGKEAESSAGPQSPLSPGDSGPSRGDSVENPARPKQLW